MHMADALLSAPIGVAGWLVAGGILSLAARRIATEGLFEPGSVGRLLAPPPGAAPSSAPAMGVLGAFVFAAQMINFTIPGTGSSGHIGGGLLLAVLLGPWAAFLVMASVLAVQALLFTDGGLLAWGCNLVNMGLFPCFVAFPFIYRPLAQRGRPALAAVFAAVVGLQLGAAGVVAETTLSGITGIPFLPFAGLMLPIHAAIGLVEGMATAGVLAFLTRVEPGLAIHARTKGRLVPVVGLLALLAAVVFSWFASTRPDGLEWSVRGVAGKEASESPPTGLYAVLARFQARTALLPDYGFGTSARSGDDAEPQGPTTWPAVAAGTSTAGVVGGLATLGLVGIAGLVLSRLRRIVTR
jgi:cobalt/nickel transport system permease protein